MRATLLFGLCLFFLIGIAGPAQAATQYALCGEAEDRWSGVLLDGRFNVIYRLCDAPVGGSCPWEEDPGKIDIDQGSFCLVIGETVELPDGDEGLDFLEIEVEGDAFERMELFGVPRARLADKALDLVEGTVTTTSIEDGTIEGVDIAEGALGSSQMEASGVTAGTYTNATFTVNTAGIVTFASSGSAGSSGDITGVTAGTGLSGGGQTGDVTLSVGTGVITSSHITDGTIANADVSTSAAIAGTKVSPDFGSQTITTSGNITTTGSGNIAVAGDLSAAGGFKHTLSFWTRPNVTASLTDTVLSIMSGSSGADARNEFVMPYSGSVVAVTVASNAARTGGTLTVEPRINGTKTTLDGVLDGTNTQYNYATSSKDTTGNTFSAGDRIDVVVTTSSADWAPNTADIVATVVVEF